MHTILHQMCTRKRHFLAISLSVLPLLTLALRNEEWDGLESLHEVSEVSPSELSVSTRKQAGALRLRPDRRVIGLSMTLEVSVSVKASPSLTSSRSDLKGSKHEWSETESINNSNACSAVYLFILICDIIYTFLLCYADHFWISHPEVP